MSRALPRRQMPLLFCASALGIVLLAHLCSISRVFIGFSAQPRRAARANGLGAKVLSREEPRTSSARPARKAPVGPRGPFSPAVDAAKIVMGAEELNKLRAEAIKAHTKVISSLVDTSDSRFGRLTLQILFRAADDDSSGALDKDEIEIAARKLGFAWLRGGKIDDLIKKVDQDDNAIIDFEEFEQAAPKILRQNLVKLAKQNGKALGFMA